MEYLERKIKAKIEKEYRKNFNIGQEGGSYFRSERLIEIIQKNTDSSGDIYTRTILDIIETLRYKQEKDRLYETAINKIFKNINILDELIEEKETKKKKGE